MIQLRVQPGMEAARALSAIKAVAWDHPGDEELVLLVNDRRLALGPMWRYSGSEACRAALSEYGVIVEPRGSRRGV